MKDLRMLEATVMLSCLVVLVTASTLPWTTVSGRDAHVAKPPANEYFMGAHHARAMCQVEHSDAGLLYIKDSSDVTQLLELLRNSSATAGSRPKRLYISRYRNSTNYYQATWLETDSNSYDIPDADIVQQNCPIGYTSSSGSCFMVYTGSFVTYDIATMSCKYEEGGVLASIKDATQWASVTGLLSTGVEYYIGAKYSSGDWAWENGMNIDESFMPTEGSFNDGECALLGYNGTDWVLKGRACGNNHTYVCQAALDPLKQCMVIESPSGAWSSLQSGGGGGDVVFKNEYCCLPEMNVEGALCTKPVTSSIDAGQLLNETCEGGCGEGWFTKNSKCFMAVSINSSATPAANGTYEAQRACYSTNPASDLVSSITNWMTHNFFARLLNVKDMVSGDQDLVYLGIHDIGRGSYMDHMGTAISTYLNTKWAGPINQNATENCVVLNATTGGWMSVAQHTFSNVNCCEDLMVTWAVCEKDMNMNITVMDAQMNTYAKECYESINECETPQMVNCNNGTCWNKVLEYTCNCTLGYKGKHCETDIDYCAGDAAPRVPKCDVDNTVDGSCKEWVDPVKGIEAVNCTCKHDGINGTTCENLWNACGSDPCQWGGTCVPEYNVGYTCLCPLGATGVDCETNVDDCLPEYKNVTCYNGGTCTDTVDKLHDATCKCAPGFIGVYCDIEVKCKSDDLPSGLANSNSTYNQSDVIHTDPLGVMSFGLHAEVMMRCSGGHKYSDGEIEKNITCGQSNWIYPEGLNQNNFPDCDPHCESHPVVANADKQSNVSQVGTVMNYTCLPGHRFPDNSTMWNTTCMMSPNPGAWGIWSPPSAPACEVMLCPVLPDNPNQFMDTRNRTHDTTVTFWCAVGYELYDGTTARTLKCMFGEWAAELPLCQPVRCEEKTPFSQLTGISRNSTENTYNTYVKYECDAGQRMVDGGTYRILKCDASKEWSDSVTSCGFDRCYPLPYVVNATASTNNATCSQGPIKLNCDPGHRFFPQDLHGNDYGIGTDFTTIECVCDTSKHQWRPLTIKACKPVNCPVFALPRNAYRSDESTLYGTLLGIMCDKGHYYDAATMHNAVYGLCTGTAVWNISDASVSDCWPIQCSNPPVVKNGTRQYIDANGNSGSFPQLFNYTEEIVYECNNGTKFIDGTTTRKIHCNEFGVFSDNDVSCIAERCNPVPGGAFVEPNSTDTAWYSNVSYSCIAGHEWSGSFPADYTYNIYCRVTGSNSAEWTAVNGEPGVQGVNVPSCTPKKCPIEPKLEHSETNVTDRVPFNTIKEIKCNAGYNFKYYGKIKSLYKRCNEEGQWEWQMNGVSLDPKYPVAAAHANDPKVCIIVECPKDPVAYLRHVETPRLAYIPWFQSYPWAWGNVTNATLSNNTYKYNEIAEYKCIDGYQYENKDTVRSFKCNENETWTYERPSPYINDAYLSLSSYWCEVKFCQPVPDWSYNITLTNLSNSNEFESVIQYSCKNDQVFTACIGLPEDEDCPRMRTTTCKETKQWDPPYFKCQSTSSIGAELVGFRAEAPNSVAFGTFACSLLCVMLAVMVLLDLNKLYTDCKIMHANVSSLINRNNKVSDSSAGLNSESTA